MTQVQIIKEYLARENRWIKSYDLRGVQTCYGWIGHQGDRRARELAEAGEIEVKHEGKYAEYKTKQPKKAVALFITNPNGTREQVTTIYE